ncbi:MAG: archease [Isosphaeraceae bacterium]
MGTVETFDHTADVGLRIKGADLDDLFRTAAEGLFDYVVANRNDVRITLHESVELVADSTIDLLVLWLNELIYRCETQHVLYNEFTLRVDEEGRSLLGEIGGESIDRERHVLDHEVKAVTHHALDLRWEEGGGWVAEVILDI